MTAIDELRKEFATISILQGLCYDVANLPATNKLFEVELKPFGFTRSMDWLVVTEDESGESRYPCYYADSAFTIYDEYKPERIYRRTGKRAVARLEYKLRCNLSSPLIAACSLSCTTWLWTPTPLLRSHSGRNLHSGEQISAP